MENLRRPTNPIRMRNYGRIIQDMIQVAAQETNPQMQQAQVIYIAQCMRQKNLQWNRDLGSDISRVKEDICTLSEGRLSCDFPDFEAEVQRNGGQRFNKHK